MSAESDRELAELLPWLANGTLTGEERAAVLDLVSRSPEAAQQLRLWQAVQREARRESAEAGADMGWRRLEKSVRQEAARGQPARYWRMAAAAAAITIIGFQSLILWRIEERDSGLIQLGAPTAAVTADEWLVQVRFTGAATVGQVTELLAAVEGRIVNGPSALGVYEIAVTRGVRFADSAVLLEWLRTQPVVAESALPPQRRAVPP